MRHWFALQVRTKHERTVAKLLCAKEVETFLPVYTARRQWKDRIHEAEEPLFCGYVFCQFDPTVRLPILMTPGVVSVVSYGKIPAPLADEEIAAVRTMTESRVRAEPWPHPQIGSRVQIERGPLAGLVGVLVSVKSSLRFVVSVNLIQRSIAAEVDGEMLGFPVKTLPRRAADLSN
jgi:transcription antitermination factor NusG